MNPLSHTLPIPGHQNLSGPRNCRGKREPPGQEEKLEFAPFIPHGGDGSPKQLLRERQLDSVVARDWAKRWAGRRAEQKECVANGCVATVDVSRGPPKCFQ